MHNLQRLLAGAALRIGSLETRPRRRRRPESPPSDAPAAFDVYTFVTDERQYAELEASLAAAGFRPPVAHLIALRDRRTPGGTDPYELISRIGAARDRAYTILVHQDVRLDLGRGARDLTAALEHLSAVDPSWVVAGNAGGKPDLQLVRRLRDPYGGGTSDPLPIRVTSLDENFLVFNRRNTPRCTPGLEGFHFYGTDVCLNAALDGYRAYVIDFPITHLSHGKRGRSYDDAKQRFLDAWQSRLLFTFIRAPTEVIFISRSSLLRRAFGGSGMRARVEEVVPPLRLDDDL